MIDEEDFDFDCNKCEVDGCNNWSTYEGWYRHIDHFTGKPTGLISVRNVCHEHVCLLIGYEENKEQL